jgi:hypothetical protein
MIIVQSQPEQIVPRDPISKYPSHTHIQKRASGVAQGIGREFKPQSTKKKKKKKRDPISKIPNTQKKGWFKQ